MTATDGDTPQAPSIDALSEQLKEFASEIERNPDVLTDRSSAVAEYIRYMAERHDEVDAANKHLHTLRLHYENAEELASKGPIKIPALQGSADVEGEKPAREVTLTPNALRLGAWAESLRIAIELMQEAGIEGINLLPLQDLRLALVDLEPQEAAKLMSVLFGGTRRRADRIALMTAQEAAAEEIEEAEKYKGSLTGASNRRGYKELAEARGDGVVPDDVENDTRISFEIRNGMVKPRPRKKPETAEEKARKDKELALFEGLFEVNRRTAKRLMQSGGEKALQEFIRHQAKYAASKKPAKTG